MLCDTSWLRAFVSLWHPWLNCAGREVYSFTSKKVFINALVGRELLSKTSPKRDAVTLPTLEVCHLVDDDCCLVLCYKLWASSNVILSLSNTIAFADHYLFHTHKECYLACLVAEVAALLMLLVCSHHPISHIPNFGRRGCSLLEQLQKE